MNAPRPSCVWQLYDEHPVWFSAVLLAVTLVSLAGASRLWFSDDYRELFRTNHADFTLLEEITEQFGGDDNEVAILVQTDDILRSEAVEVLEVLTSELESIEGVASVVSPTTVSGLLGLADQIGEHEELIRLREAVRQHPLLGSRLISDDLKAALVIARLDQDRRSLDAIEPVLVTIEAVIDRSARAGFEISRTGMPFLRAEIVRSAQRDQVLFTTVGMVLGGLIALAMFRHPAPAALVGAGSLVGTIWTVGAMGWCREPFNVINNVVPVLVLVIGMTDSVHLVFEFQRLLGEGTEQRRAAREAVRHVGPACALTSLTTILGFLSLSFADFGIIRRFGLTCAAGLALSFLAVVTVVPLLAGRSPLGRPVKRRFSMLHPRLRPILSAFRRHGGWTVAGGGLLLLLAAGSLFLLKPDYRYREYLPAGSPTLAASDGIEGAFGGVWPLRVVVDWPLQASESKVFEVLSSVERVLAASPVAHSPLSLLAPLRALGGSDTRPSDLPGSGLVPAEIRNGLWRSSMRRTLVSARVPWLGAAELERHFDELEVVLEQLELEHPGFRLRLNGLLVVSARSSLRLITALAASLALASALIFVTLCLALRSLRLGLVSLPPNLLPLGAICSFLVATGRPLQFTTVTLLSVILAISVDDTIHLLVGFRRARGRGCGVERAIESTLDSVGGALIATTCLLIAGFGSVALSETPPMSLFGWLACLALAVALVADLVLLPALLRVAQEIDLDTL